MVYAQISWLQTSYYRTKIEYDDPPASSTTTIPDSPGSVIITAITLEGKAPELSQLGTYGSVRIGVNLDIDSGDLPTYAYVFRSTDGGAYTYIGKSEFKDEIYSTVYVDTTIQNGHIYRYRARSVASGFAGTLVNSIDIPTTPNPPVGLKLVSRGKNSAVISWTNKVRSDLYTRGWLKTGSTEEESFTIKASSNTRTITGLSPTKSYSVAIAHTTSPYYWTKPTFTFVGDAKYLTSSRTAALTIPAGTTPKIPDLLTPQDTWLVGAGTQTISWRHNPTDGSAQEGYQIRFRDTLHDDWVTLDAVKSGTSSTSLDLSLFESTLQAAGVESVDGRVCEWQVRTCGMTETYGGWSTSAFIRFDYTAGCTITAPEVIEARKIFVSAASNTPAPFQYKIVCTSPDGTETEKTGYTADGSGFSAEFDGFEDGNSYTFTPYTGKHILTAGTPRTLVCDYEEVTPPDIVAEFDESAGTVTVTIVNDMTHEINTAVSSRSGDGEWRTIATDVPLTSTITDFTPLLGNTIEYRVEVRSLLGNIGYAQTSIRVFPKHGYLISEDGQINLAVVWNPEHSRKLGLANSSVQYFLGRDKPVMLAGKETTRTVSIKTEIMPEDAAAEIPKWDAAAAYPRPLLYRDPTGWDAWVALTDTSMEWNRSDKTWVVSFTGVEVGR